MSRSQSCDCRNVGRIDHKCHLCNTTEWFLTKNHVYIWRQTGNTKSLYLFFTVSPLIQGTVLILPVYNCFFLGISIYFYLLSKFWTTGLFQVPTVVTLDLWDMSSVMVMPALWIVLTFFCKPPRVTLVIEVAYNIIIFLYLIKSII